ncbi:TonB-linked SusC/RagA family outer membrane protein [Pedobacter africanus]|uniref:TonB-linked SusC/RagA family outer membrane protein n=1 Tax=Pedobacter africanus TaxID=151894 RepID=A0ACC6L1Z6_9SPHI|nr:TonB-dependent receptor [Pedobacter africanus]MDR6785619.1 TonB-linked SusC/RagA family outer membrane protein [Pedobacter africanus]
MRKIYLFLMCMIWSITVFAQQTRRVEGKVTEQGSGLPLIGVSVQVKGTKTGATTDQDGRYAIQVPSQGSSTLVFTYVGYLQKEMSVGDKGVINLTLAEDSKTLNDVVVIGYGTVARKDITGSVSSVNMDDMSKAPVKSFDEALAGRIAGVQVSSSEGKPGAGINIIVRGSNSLTQDNSPLYVIDGFPIEGPDNNVLSPSEIESIEVLKDASATAIYGARGANGVILITSKKGKEGAPVINYNGYYGFQRNINTVEMMDPYEFVKLQNEIDPVGILQSYFKDGKTLESYRNEQGINWQDRLFRTAPMHNHDISLRGGSNNTRYSVSANMLGQDGVIINSGFRRYQGKVTLDQNINKKFKVGTNLFYTSTKTFGTSPSAPDAAFSAMNYLMYSVWGYRPLSGSNFDLENSLTDPDLNPTNDYRINPILSAKNELRQTFTNNFIGNAYGEYQLSKDLKLKVSGGVNRTSSRNESFNNSLTRYGYAGSTDKVNGTILYTDVNNWLNENTLTYNKTINKDHTINILGGVTFQGSDYHRYGVSANHLPNESLGLSGLDEGIPVKVTAINSEWSLMSFLSRVNYNYKGRYLLTGSFRADGSSKFRADNRWSYFPSAAFAWRAINEDFLKKSTVFSDAKLRMSWGITGNNRVSDYASYARLSFDNTSGVYNAYYAFNNSLQQGVYPTSLANLDLKWENTAQSNLGVDLGFLKQRITLTMDYYKKTTSDLLLNAQLPLTTGYVDAFKNIGKTSNAGFEFALNTVNVDTKNFSWNSSLNISFNRNKVLELTQNQESLLTNVNWDQDFKNLPLYIAKKGQPLGQMYGYIWEGVYQYSDFDQLPNGSYVLKDLVTTNTSDRSSATTIKPGDIKYKDLNGDGVINDNDRTVIGRGYPIHQGGFNNNFRYKQFDLGVFMQWSYGNDIVNANRLLFEAGNKTNLNQYATFQNRWTPENTNTDMPRVGGKGPNAYSSRIIEDGSYLRLKTVSLGYTFEPSLLKRMKVKTLRVYASAQNLFTWTNYSGSDPEVSVYYTALTPGFDYSSYPRPKTITFGLNLSL